MKFCVLNAESLNTQTKFVSFKNKSFDKRERF